MEIEALKRAKGRDGPQIFHILILIVFIYCFFFFKFIYSNFKNFLLLLFIFFFSDYLFIVIGYLLLFKWLAVSTGAQLVDELVAECGQLFVLFRLLFERRFDGGEPHFGLLQDGFDARWFRFQIAAHVLRLLLRPLPQITTSVTSRSHKRKLSVINAMKRSGAFRNRGFFSFLFLRWQIVNDVSCNQVWIMVISFFFFFFQKWNVIMKLRINNH